MFFFPVRCMFVAVVTFAALFAKAQDFQELEAVLQEHPSLAELHYQAEAKREQATAVTALPDPDFSIGINNVPLSDPSFDRFLPTHKSIGVQQQIPNAAKRHARSAAMYDQANQLQAEAAMRYAQLRGRLLVDLVTLQRIDTDTNLLNQQTAKLDQFRDVIQAEIDAGRPVVFRLAEVTARRAELAHQLVELERERTSVESSLIELVGTVPPPVVPAIRLQPFSGASEQFHAVRVAQHQTHRSANDRLAAEAQWKPDWGVELAYQQRDTGRGLPDAQFRGDDWFTARISFSAPIWSSRKQAPGLRAAQAVESSTKARLRSVTRASLARYHQLDAQRVAAIDTQRSLQEHIQALEEARHALNNRYESGEGDYAPIVDNEMAVLVLNAQLSREHSRERIAIIHANAMWVSP